jgi:hypothetical protein
MAAIPLGKMTGANKRITLSFVVMKLVERQTEWAEEDGPNPIDSEDTDKWAAGVASEFAAKNLATRVHDAGTKAAKFVIK